MLVYKSEHNYNRGNNLLLLVINYDEKYYHFPLKSKLDLYSFEWLRRKTVGLTPFHLNKKYGK